MDARHLPRFKEGGSDSEVSTTTVAEAGMQLISFLFQHEQQSKESVSGPESERSGTSSELTQLSLNPNSQSEVDQTRTRDNNNQ